MARRTDGVVADLRDWRWRKPLTALFLVLLLFATLFARDVWTSKSQAPANADTCVTEDRRWRMQAGEVPLDYGKVHFGATICYDRNATITGVEPFLEGGI